MGLCFCIFSTEFIQLKGPSSQGCGFSSSQVWMWELDCEESGAPKNWCFWTVVLEKTLKSSLDCKEIQPVHSKEDQSWVFFGRNDAKAETPVFWPRYAKSWLIGKDSDSGRDWGQEEKGMTEDEMAGWHHRLDGLEFEWTPGVDDGQGGLACCNSWGRKESDTTEWLNWTELNWRQSSMGPQQGHHKSNVYSTTHVTGLPWWFSGKEPTCQCSRHGCNPCLNSRNIFTNISSFNLWDKPFRQISPVLCLLISNTGKMNDLPKFTQLMWDCNFIGSWYIAAAKLSFDSVIPDGSELLFQTFGRACGHKHFLCW